MLLNSTSRVWTLFLLTIYGHHKRTLPQYVWRIQPSPITGTVGSEQDHLVRILLSETRRTSRETTVKWPNGWIKCLLYRE